MRPNIYLKQLEGGVRGYKTNLAYKPTQSGGILLS